MSKLRFIKRVHYYADDVCAFHILQQYGEIEQSPNSIDSEGNPIYDGPTIEGWYDVPHESCAHRFEKFSGGIISCQDCGEPQASGEANEG